jgi:bla regulator protein blaR1
MPFIGDANFLQALGWAVLNSLWQMAFLWVVFQVVLSFGITKPSVKSRLAALTLSVGFGWFLFTLINHWFIDPLSLKRSLFTIATFEAGNSADWQDKLQLILPYASFVYLLLLSIPVFGFIRNYRFVQLIRKQGLSKADVEIRMFVKRLAERMGIHKPVHVYLSSLITSPVTVGFLKPVILMPIAAISQLSTKQVEAILLHELSHIRRYDYFINLWVNFIMTVLYFNPFVKLFSKTIEREREKSCDESVIQFQYDPYGYAAALLELEKNNYARQTMAIAASGQKNDLLHRVERILGVEKRRAPDMRKISGLLLGLLCIISMNALFFFSSPIIKNNSLAVTPITNPFYQLIFDGGKNSVPVVTKENKEEQPSSKYEAPAQKIARKEMKDFFDEDAQENVQPPPYITVAGYEEVMPVLDTKQEAQVQEAVEATRKVMQQSQWKQMEKNVAEAMTQIEKEDLKLEYYRNLEKRANWKALENRLRLSYDNINWENVNLKLNAAVNTIVLDSIKQTYSIVLRDLNQVETWMTQNNCNYIPDTDLKLEEVKIQKDKLQQQLNTINSARKKKIIHL